MSHPLNVVLLRGRLLHDAELRTLVSGSDLVFFEVAVRRPGERDDRVPVAVRDAPPEVAKMKEGEGVVVIGRVRRRFFKAGGSTASRTEVAADLVVPMSASDCIDPVRHAAALLVEHEEA